MKKNNLIQSLKFEALSFSYPNEENLFQSVDFDFPTQSTVTIEASSVAGRSALLQILAGLVLPTAGRYLINDKNVTEMSFEEFLPFRKKIGYSFDLGGLIHNKTLFENCMLPLSYHKVYSEQDSKEKVMQLFSKFKIEKLANKRPSEVMGANRKLANLLRAVILDPEMLLLDDPTVGLSQETSLLFFDHLDHLKLHSDLKHIFISSFDEKFLGLFEHQEILIDNGLIHFNVEEAQRKSANL